MQYMKRVIAYAAMAAAAFVLVWSCNEKSGPETVIVYGQGEWVRDVRSTAYFNLYPDELFPGVILQAEGVKRLYSDSPFVQANFTEDLVMDVFNPGEGATLTLCMAESEINAASEYSYTVSSADTAYVLSLQVPVDWKYEALLMWDYDRAVKLDWDVLIDGQPVQSYTKQFICRTLRAFIGTVEFVKSVSANATLTEMLHDPEIVGSFPVRENQTMMSMHLSAFVAGLIDESSPLIERLKGEVFQDGYADILTGIASSAEEDLLNNVDAYSYLMQKYDIHYATRHANNAVQYLRTIDEIFENHNGYCAELGLAFVSWCLNLGINCTFELVPGHLTTSVYGSGVNAEGEAVMVEHPFDTTMSASWMSGYGTDFSTPPTEEEFAASHDFFNLVLYNSQLSEEEYEADMLTDPLYYCKFDPAVLRKYLPSFNIGARDYISATKASMAEKRIRPVENPLWTAEGSPVLVPVSF